MPFSVIGKLQFTVQINIDFLINFIFQVGHITI